MTRLLLGALLVLGIATPPAGAQAPTTVIIVRHAERATEPADDPVLTPAGSERAEALLAAVRGAGITHILTTELSRTRLTAAPTATALGITPATVSTRSPQHVAAVIDSVRARAGGVILVVGHSNTVPGIVNGLGGQAPEICDMEYDNLYVVTLPPAGANPRVIRSRYGRATPVAADCSPMMVPTRK